MNLADARERLRGNGFAVLGRAGMDFYADPPGTPIAAASRFVSHLGGSAANIAVQLVKLGARAQLLSCLSDDAVGRFCLAQLEHYGVGCDHICMAGGGLRTSLAVVETRLENCQSVIYRNGAADFAFSVEDVAGLDFGAEAALIVTGTALAAPGSRAATMAALAKARAAGLVTVIDIDYRPYSWESEDAARDVNLAAARACDLVVGNDVEFGLLAGQGGDGLAMARSLVAKGAAAAIYKMGELGAVTISGDEEFRTGIYATKALKPTGAGDAFMGGFLSGLASGLDLRNAVLRGSAAAAITVSRVGCAPAMPDAAELQSFLASTPEPACS
ncbi:PfkB family carbohydrate kinase [Aestuariivirga sp.]|jgi:5-dehydro-2-deoxygluconokinase|uniref:PfkB family carbohydrate kinase n=1 Tax=Aestuariivirga sp. TaxID=2650926 RepID=UPI00378520E8